MTAPLRRLAPLLGLALLAVSGSWLLRGAWRAGPAPAPALADAERELGRRKLQSFCLSCHSLDGSPSQNPLAPRVRGWSRERAYVDVGRLDQLSPAMLLNFEGTDEERWALAGALERLGAGERP